jgi:very-short-patch-repair endonuclease
MGNKSDYRTIARVAARQHGVISTAQLRNVGVARDVAAKWNRDSKLHRIYRGVYAVGHGTVKAEGRWMAAVLACNGAVLSHRSAAELWGLLNHASGPVHVSVPTQSGRKQRADIRIHRRATLTRGAIMSRRNIPVTRPAQTIADLRHTTSEAEFRHAIRQAGVLGLPTGLADRDPTRSELEDIFLALCRSHDLPGPEVNVHVGAHLVDFLWRDRRLVVETDGYRYHRSRIAFEQDRRRDLDLREEGYEVHRFSSAQIANEPTRIAAALRRGTP